MTTLTPWWRPDRHADRKPFLLARSRVIAAIRTWFEDEGFIEIEPNALVVSPGNETHLQAFPTELLTPQRVRRPMFLHTSPEFACKKLLAAGETKLFTFASVFRNAELGPLHAPEFTMLEWYRTGDAGNDRYAAVQQDCMKIVRIAAEAAANSAWRWKERSCDTRLPACHKTVADVTEALFGIDLMGNFNSADTPDYAALAATNHLDQIAKSDESWADLFSKLMVEVERRYAELPDVKAPDHQERLLVLDRFPAMMSPLARPVAIDPSLAFRFEIFVAGVELANGYGEDNDADRVRSGLEAAMDEKERIYGERYPIDEDLLAALPEIPTGTAGCAMGLDRLVMLATGASNINQVRWTPLTE